MINESAPEKSAPGALYLVQRFVNSVDLESHEEELTDPEALRAWFAQRELMGADEAVSAADLRRALDVREGLRALLLANNGHELDAGKVGRLDRAASRAGVRLRFGEQGDPRLVPDAGGVDGALARLMAIVAAAVEQGRWERLKACPAEDCEWAFYDHSKNRSGRWCKMAVCGNQQKARTYRERRRQPDAPRS
jgi:predicted RNA-binding Zn ribbon-like protein